MTISILIKMIFSKSRVANFCAGSVILFTAYAVVFQTIPSEMVLVLTTLSGFSAKHLFDSGSDSQTK